MYSPKRSSGKVSEQQIAEHCKRLSKDAVTVEKRKDPDNNYTYRVSITGKYCRKYYPGRQKRTSTGYKILDSNGRIDKVNADAVAEKVHKMNVDLIHGYFDETLVKYELKNLVSIDGGKKPEPTLLELWEKFKEYKEPQLSKTHFRQEWNRTYSNAIKAAVEKTDKTPIEIRNHIVSNLCSEHAKNILARLEEAYQWGIQHDIVEKNPFIGMAKEIVIKKKQKTDSDEFDEFEDTRAFTVDEMNIIIEYFENNIKIKHWADYVKFLFYTGCRLGEAAALRWKHILPDCRVIRFTESYNSEFRITKSTKTETTRIFKCHNKLQNLLLAIKPDDAKPDELVFKSKLGKQINPKLFGRVWRGHSERGINSVIYKLIEQGKVRTYLKPSATRHTFVTHQVDADKPCHVVAAWVGNSADVIWKHYYQHKHDEMPADM